MPGWGFLLLLFPRIRNFTPIVSATQLGIMCIIYTQGTAEEQPLADTVITGKITHQKR